MLVIIHRSAHQVLSERQEGKKSAGNKQQQQHADRSGSKLKQPIEAAPHAVEPGSLLLSAVNLAKGQHKHGHREGETKREETQQEWIQRFHRSTTERWRAD